MGKGEMAWFLSATGIWRHGRTVIVKVYRRRWAKRKREAFLGRQNNVSKIQCVPESRSNLTRAVVLEVWSTDQ